MGSFLITTSPSCIFQALPLPEQYDQKCTDIFGCYRHDCVKSSTLYTPCHNSARQPPTQETDHPNPTSVLLTDHSIKQAFFKDLQLVIVPRGNTL